MIVFKLRHCLHLTRLPLAPTAPCTVSLEQCSTQRGMQLLHSVGHKATNLWPVTLSFGFFSIFTEKCVRPKTLPNSSIELLQSDNLFYRSSKVEKISQKKKSRLDGGT